MFGGRAILSDAENNKGSPINGFLIAGNLISFVVAGGALIASFLSPYSERFESLKASLSRNDAVDEVSIQDRLSVHAKLATIDAKFAEIETQFRNLDERTRRIEESNAKAELSLTGQLKESQLDREAIHAQLAAVTTKFAEVETQFRALKEHGDNAFSSLDRILSSRLDAVSKDIDQLSILIPKFSVSSKERGTAVRNVTGEASSLPPRP